jgi:Rrf2 family transcriptional regulator, cysteine metabolism repressor
MKVSVRATYGILAAMDIALHGRELPVQAKAIAARHGIPARFLEQVLNGLKKAGLIDSVRGAQGGYLLMKAPPDISLAQIVEALDGPLTASNSRKSASRRLRSRAKLEALLGEVWEQIRQAELAILSAVTLNDIMARHAKLEQQSALMYHI